MSSPETDEDDSYDLDAYTGLSDFDFDDNSEQSSDDDSLVNQMDFDDSDDTEDYGFLSGKPSRIKTYAFVWKNDLRQRFTGFFQEEISAEAIISVEAFAERHNLNDALTDDLLELLMNFFGKIICSNCNHSSCENVASQPSTSKKAVPDSTVTDASIKSENSDNQHMSVALTRNMTCQNKVLLSTDHLPSENFKVAKAESSRILFRPSLESSPAGGSATMKTRNERPPVTSEKFQDNNKRKLQYCEEPPPKRMYRTFEDVMEKRENGHFFCKLCEVPCTSKKNAKDHLIGKTHKKNKKAKVTIEQQKKISGAAKTDASQPTCNRQRADVNIATIRCNLCNINISGEDNAKEHFAGRRHLKNKKRQKTGFFPDSSASISDIHSPIIVSEARSNSSASVSEAKINNSSASISEVQCPMNVSEDGSNSSGIFSKRSNSPLLFPSDIEEIASNSNVTEKLREIYRAGQKEVDNEPDSECE